MASPDGLRPIDAAWAAGGAMIVLGVCAAVGYSIWNYPAFIGGAAVGGTLGYIGGRVRQ